MAEAPAAGRGVRLLRRTRRVWVALLVGVNMFRNRRYVNAPRYCKSFGDREAALPRNAQVPRVPVHGCQKSLRKHQL
jgi:hypothetical protein